MHAIYNFLINTKETHGFNPKEPPSPSEFENWFHLHYLQYHGDENNWYQGQLLIYSSGKIHQLCPEEDWRGRDQLYDFYEKMRPSHRWEHALDSAAQCLAYDFNLLNYSGFSIGNEDNKNPIEEMHRADILSAIEDHIISRLDDAKKWFTTKKSIYDKNTDLMNSDYAIRRLLVQSAHFIEAQSYDHRYSMFSSPHSAYDSYRCMDIEGGSFILKDEKEPPVLCIAVVDIHT